MTDPAQHFENLYRSAPDPWNYTTSAYEALKYDATLGALLRPRYENALEAGCSIGVLSARLAARCDRLLALDLVDLAVLQATARLAGFDGATARRATLPQDWPEGRYDLIMLSELVYYLPVEGIERLAARVARDAMAEAECVLVHWQGDTQTQVSANDARDLFCATLGGLRSFETIIHPTTGEYDHRTILFRGG